MIAASSSSRGMLATKVRKMSTENGSRNATSTRIRPRIVLNRPSAWRTKIVGTMAGGMMSPASSRAATIEPTRSRRRWSTKPTIAANSTIRVTEATVSRMLFRIAVTINPFRASITSPMFSISRHSVGG